MPASIDNQDVTEVTIDGQEVSEITADGDVVFTTGGGASPPSSTVLQYDATQLTGLNDGDTVSTFTEQINSHDASAQGAPTYVTNAINGNAAVKYNGEGGSDAHSNTTFGPISQPFAKLVVLVDEANTGRSWVSDGISQRAIVGTDGDASEVLMWASNFVEGGSYSANTEYLLAGAFDGSNSELRLDGSVQASADPGNNGHEDITLAHSDDLSTNAFGGLIGELLVITDLSELSQAESYLANKWGITI